MVERAKDRAKKRDWLRFPQGSDILERVARYQTTTDRRYDRFLERLIKIQRLRKKRSAGRRAARGK